MSRHSDRCREIAVKLMKKAQSLHGADPDGIEEELSAWPHELCPESQLVEAFAAILEAEVPDPAEVRERHGL
jgi:hypothetical protein